MGERRDTPGVRSIRLPVSTVADLPPLRQGFSLAVRLRAEFILAGGEHAMKTRTLYHTDLSFDIEHRTDGWYYRISYTDDFEGPYRTLAELSEEFVAHFEAYLRWMYELIHKEAPR